MESASSTTFKREDLARGFEPDECFYFTNIEAVRGKRNVNLNAGDPPPDLIFEADLSNPSLNKLPIYARLGIAEVWRYDGGRLEILSRNSASDGYEVVVSSASLLSLTSADLTRVVDEDSRRGVRPGSERCASGRGTTIPKVIRWAVSERQAAAKSPAP